jgi:uncharacterized protein
MRMRFATLISWLLTASLGGYMLRTWIARGGLRRERARAGGLPPPLIFGHAGLAITGLLIWTGYLASGPRVLAWTAVGVLMVTVGLGLSTVTLWTPYPAPKPGERRGAAHWEESAVVVPDTAAGVFGDPDPLDYTITDEMIAQLLEEPHAATGRRVFRPDPAILIPIAHGFAAIATFVLAVMTASTPLSCPVRSAMSLADRGPGADTSGVGDRNVLGGELEPCGNDPLTGFYRDGCCNTGPEDLGSHTICAVVTAEFLEHQRSIGNDLTTPMPQFRFPGLVPGDRWCVTAANWLRAYADGVAAPVVLACTHERALEIVPLSALKQHSVDVPGDASALDNER